MSIHEITSAASARSATPGPIPASGDPIQIQCLACGAARVVFSLGDTGDCPRCHYVGWTYSDELDGFTRRMIMNGRLATPPPAPRYLRHRL